MSSSKKIVSADKPEAVEDSPRQREYEKIREAYIRQPDSAAEADDWSSAEEWKA